MRRLGRDLLTFSKDLIADQTTVDINDRFNTSGLNFDAVEGYGDAAATSMAFYFSFGGFDDQRIRAVMKYPAPTTAGSEDIGVMARMRTLDSPNATYYYARIDAGDAKITKIVDGSFTTLASEPFPLPQDELVTIDFSVVGSQLSASFSAATPGDLNIAANDSEIAGGGLLGCRSFSAALWVRSVEAWQL